MTSQDAKKPSVSPVLPGQQAGGFLTPFNVQIDSDLLERALTHRSWSYENDRAPHNERLEFLGDSVLGLTVTDYLFKTFPSVSEADLTKRRAAVVSTVSLAAIARSVGLGPHIKLGRGERAGGGADKDSILADTLEAIIGAVYIANDIQVAMSFVLKLVEPALKNVADVNYTLDPKTALQEIMAAHGKGHPQYTVVGSGPDHQRLYTATVTVLDVTARGEGTSKKTAELAAARKAFSRLQQLGRTGLKK